MEESSIKTTPAKLVTIKFERHPEYRRCHATGFWGGITSSGELVFDIFEDLPVYPDSLKVTFAQDNRVINEERFGPGENNVIRLQHIGVTIPISIIPSIIKWLQEKLKEYESLSKTQ